MGVWHGAPHVDDPLVIPVQPFDPVCGVNHPPDFPLVLEVGEIEPVPVVAISFQNGITFLPPGNKLFKFTDCFIWLHLFLLIKMQSLFQNSRTSQVTNDIHTSSSHVTQSIYRNINT